MDMGVVRCERKVRYTRKHAIRVQSKLRDGYIKDKNWVIHSNTILKKSKIVVDFYQCQYCGWYHMTEISDERRIKLKRV